MVALGYADGALLSRPPNHAHPIWYGKALMPPRNPGRGRGGMGTVLSGVRGHAGRQRIQRERARGSKDDTGGVEGEWRAADEGARGVGEDSRVVGESGERRRRAHAGRRTVHTGRR